MKRQFLLYLDTCVFSNMLEPGHEVLRQAFLTVPDRVAFSNVHLAEMQGNPAAYARLLDDLNAVFVRNPGDEHGRYHPISSLDAGEPFHRLSEHSEFAPIHDAFDAMLMPIHHLMGGRRDVDLREITNSTAARIRSSIGQLLSEASDGILDGIPESSYQTLNETTESLLSLDVGDGWRQIDAQFKAARDGDPMRHMRQLEKVDYLFSVLDQPTREAIVSRYPKGFATQSSLEVGDVAGFVSFLFASGLISRSQIFSGSHQERKFLAQFRDAQHIEAASRCDCFITFDKGASELASACFAYAGFPTEVILLKAY